MTVIPLWAVVSTDSQFKLDNGLQVVLSNIPDRKAVAVLCYYTTGASDDPQGFEGFSYIYGSMHGFLTTENQRSYYSFRRLTENGGFPLNRIAHDYCYFLQLATEEELNNVLWSESENIFLLSPTEGELQSLKEYAARTASLFGPQNSLFTARTWMLSQVFQAYPGYANPLIGIPNQIRDWNTAGISRQLTRFKDPARVILVVCGAFNPVEARRSIQKYFEEMGSPSPFVAQTTLAKNSLSFEPTRKRSWLREAVDQHYLAFGFRLPGIRNNKGIANEDYFIVQALCHFLTHPNLNHLNQMLNITNHLNISISPEMTDNITENCLTIQLGAKDRVTLEKAKFIVNSEIASLQNLKISLSQLKAIKSSLRVEFYKKMANLGERAIVLAQTFHFFGHINAIDQFEKNLARIDTSSMMRVAKKYFQEEKQIVLYVIKKD